MQPQPENQPTAVNIQTTKFEGTFTPPVMGSVHAPIRIAGRGTCELSTDEIVLNGHAPKGVAGTILLGCIGAVIGWVAVEWMFPTFNSSYLGGALGLGLMSVAFTQRSADNRRSVRIRFPYSAIKTYSLNPQIPGELQIVVKGESVKGMLHFVPDGRPDALATELATRGVGPRI